jgi:hypothetical protein
MTPKEKAEELVDKNYQIFEDDEDVHFIDTSERISKQCALIAVDEIQKIKSVYHDDTLYDYWEEVKKEIINL